MRCLVVARVVRLVRAKVRSDVFLRRAVILAVLALAVAACGGEPPPAVSGLIPAQSFRLDVDWVDGTPVAKGEADHWLHTQPLHEVLSSRQFEPDNRGEAHALELVGNDGTVLESHPVYVGTVYVDPGPSFEHWVAVFEDPPDYAALRFVHGSRTVYEERRSAHPPEVSFLSLETGQVFAGDAQFRFRLLVDDEDKDDLEIVILVSVDGGSYKHDRAGFSGTSFSGSSRFRNLKVEDYGLPLTVTSGVRTLGIPRIVAEGSQAVRLLAVVSDGSRVAAAQSPEFALEPLDTPGPTLELHSMRDGQVIGWLGPFDIGALVVEEGFKDGDQLIRHTYFPQPVEDPAVRWTSDIDGDITEQIKPQRESGGLIEIDQSPRRLRGLDDEPIIDSGRIDADALTPGTHELTATFTADSGLQASDSVTVTILGPDDPIAAMDDNLEISVGETLEHPVTDNDVETSRRIDPDTLEIVAPPRLGTAAVFDMPPDRYGIVERVIQYTPNDLVLDEGSRDDRLTYRICDRGPDPRCATAQLRITIHPSG